MNRLAGLKRILSNIAHEIKNPIGAISLHIQILEQDTNECNCGKKGEDIKYSIGVLKEEVNRLSNIVDDFLSNFRLKNKNLIDVNLNDFFENFVSFIEPGVNAKKISIKKHYSSNLPVIVTDEAHLKLALYNLVLNSISAIESANFENGVIEIEVKEDKNFIVISIIDNGPSILDEIKENIFEPYLTTKQFATGLGLTIIYEIIKELNGDVNFESNSEKTRFSIILPMN